MKYLVCLPGGGLGNMLWAINLSINYAIKYDRKLIIDSTKEGWFKKNIVDFINISHSVIIDKILTESTYTKVKLNKNYDEEVIYNYSALHPHNFDIFKYITIKKIILDEFYKRLSLLPKKFISIHIRNTDKKSDYLDFLKINETKFVGKNIFLASDNFTVIEHIKKTYGSKVFCFSNIPENKGKSGGIHYNHMGIDNQEFIIDCFVDLLLLAYADNFYFSCPKSSYSKMAKYLFDNKAILKNILGEKSSKAPTENILGEKSSKAPTENILGEKSSKAPTENIKSKNFNLHTRIFDIDKLCSKRI